VDKKLFFKVLGFLADAGINNEVDIKHLFHEVLDSYEVTTSYPLDFATSDIRIFLEKMKNSKLIDYKMRNEREGYTLYDPVLAFELTAYITQEGYNCYMAEQNRIRNDEVQDSIIKTNEITARNSRWQTIILIATLFITSGSVYVAYKSYAASEIAYKSANQTKQVEEQYLIIKETKSKPTDSITLTGKKKIISKQ